MEGTVVQLYEFTTADMAISQLADCMVDHMQQLQKTRNGKKYAADIKPVVDALEEAADDLLETYARQMMS